MLSEEFSVLMRKGMETGASQVTATLATARARVADACVLRAGGRLDWHVLAGAHAHAHARVRVAC